MPSGTGHFTGSSKRVEAHSKSSNLVVNSVALSRDLPVFPGFFEIIRVVLSNYSCGFQETTLEMHKWLLYPILTASSDDLLRGLSYRFIRNTLESVHPRKQELNAGNVTQALKAVVSLQLFKSIQPIILDYDESNLMLHVVDRGFIIWLNVQSKEDLFSAAGLPMPE